MRFAFCHSCREVTAKRGDKCQCGAWWVKPTEKVPAGVVRDYGVKYLSHGGYPVSRRLPTIEGPYTRGERDGKPVLIDKSGAHFEPFFGRRIVANRKDEERAVSDGVAERE